MKTEQVKVVAKSILEPELIQYKKLSDQIKQLTDEKEMLKKALIKTFFESNRVYANKEGTIVASYMAVDVTRLDVKLLQEEQPSLYDKYAYTQEEYRFTVSIKE